ncbi:hypothetical protein L1049_028407 [Liquidambar formosana]|uniref:PWWP domain-containing protein n=1 Tax=Liquidambar formosana TaxID=63359 RepID=A0AAP0WWH5_LIQFO
MENPKPLETLAENPDDKILEEAHGASGSSGLSDNRNGSESVSEVLVVKNGGEVGVSYNNTGVDNVAVVSGVMEVKERMDFAEGDGLVVGFDAMAGDKENCLSIGGIGKGSLVDEVVAEETLVQAVSVEFPLEGRMLVVDPENGIKSVDGTVPVREVNLSGNGGEGIGLEEIIKDEGMKEDDNEVDSAEKIEVSGGDISLVVEVCCPPTQLIRDNHDEANCFGLVVQEEAKESRGQENGEEEIDNQECCYSVGDLVWIKTKIQSWWPGQIYDPLDAAKYAAKSHESDCFLVGCFGNGNFAWCSPSQLKPFNENFEEMSRQSNSRSFLGAVDKAVDEIGRRVKLGMTCSCSLKDSQARFAWSLSW